MPKKALVRKPASQKESNPTSELKVPSFKFDFSNKNYTPALVILLIISSFFLGSFYSKVQYLEKGGVDNKVETQPADQAQPQNQQQPASALTVDAIKSWAKEIGLNMDEFNSCYDSNKYDKQINEDIEAGKASDVNGTPTVFVGDEMIVGAQPFEEFKKVIDAELAKGTSSSKQDNGRLVSGAGLPIVIYSDLECPFCTRFFNDSYTQIKKEYGDKVKFVFRHFPLEFHKGAKPAALATECANDQGKFWEMHDKIFQSQ